MIGRALTVKGLAIAGFLALGATSAAAAAGSLPDAAQNGLSKAASHVGITLPASNDNHPTKDSHPGNGKPDTTSTDPTTADAPTTPTSVTNHGSDVSDVARNTDATGRDKGAAVSAVAKGDHGQPPAAASNSDAPETPTTGAPVTTPNSGGIGTGSTASNDANSTGTDQAAPQASAGSGNAGDHPSGRP
jgi:hypothetical protein